MAISIKYIQNTNDLTANMTEVYTWLASNASPLFSSVDLDTSNSKIVLHATDSKGADVEALTLSFNSADWQYMFKNAAGTSEGSHNPAKAHVDPSGSDTHMIRMLAKTETGICIHYGIGVSLMISTAMDGGLVIAFMKRVESNDGSNVSYGVMHMNSSNIVWSFEAAQIVNGRRNNDSDWHNFSSNRASRMVIIPYVFETSYTGSMYHTFFRNINCPVDLIVVNYKGTEYLYNGVTLLR